jgi:hypothetical protein
VDIAGKTVLVLGGYGEVGMAVCRALLAHRPGRLIITSLHEGEALEAVKELGGDAPDTGQLIPFWGNLFLRWSMKDIPLPEIVSRQDLLATIVDDNLAELREEILVSSTLFRLVTEQSPDIIVDCITTATALAYQNVYQAYQRLAGKPVNPPTPGHDGMDQIYQLLATISIPPLIRHVQILYEAMKRAGTKVYLKIGTTGTGGMGFNIPFTHGEESPSRLLMTKAAVAGAHTMLLFVLHRTPGWPVIREIKPAAMIGWKGIGKGQVLRKGRPVPLYDCDPAEACRLVPGTPFQYRLLRPHQSETGTNMNGTYIDTGENGVFSTDEFRLLTALGLMEFVTPEEIAREVLFAIRGIGTTKDVLNAIDGAVMNPSYRAGFLREYAVKCLEALGGEGFSYGLLGPRVSKLILEAHLLKRCYTTIEAFLTVTPSDAALRLEEQISHDQEIRSASLSIGIPVLLPGGSRLLVARRSAPDKEWEETDWTITSESIDKWASREWVDLREANLRLWQSRFQRILGGSRQSSADSSSRHGGCSFFATKRGDGETVIDPGEVAAWVMIVEFQGGCVEAYGPSDMYGEERC